MLGIRSHLSYANVMATIAVFLALGGSGYAALRGKDKAKVRSIADQEIAAKAGGLSVASAGSASSAENAASADKLDNLDSLDIGLGYFTGRLNNMNTPLGSVVGAPSGVSAAADVSAAIRDQDRTLSPNRTIVLRRLTARLNDPVVCAAPGCGPGDNIVVAIDALPPDSDTVTTSLSCAIPTSGLSCTSMDESAAVPPGSTLRVRVTTFGAGEFFTASTDALFSWVATAN